MARYAAGIALTGAGVLGAAMLRVSVVARRDQRPRSDVIVVLGASQYDGRPSPVLRARLEHALALYRAGVAPVLAPIGGKRPTDWCTEAEACRTWLLGQGVPAQDVLAIGEGVDTVRSLRALERACAERGWRSVVLVSDPWHQLRCLTIAADLGLRAASSPTRHGPMFTHRFIGPRYALREALGWCHYLVFRDSSGLGYDVV